MPQAVPTARKIPGSEDADFWRYCAYKNHKNPSTTICTGWRSWFREETFFPVFLGPL